MPRWFALLVPATLVLAVACSDDDPGQTDTTSSMSPCTPGEERPCACDDGAEALETCAADGAGYGACGPCDPSEPTTAGDSVDTAESGDAGCGDGVCDVWETCESCSEDCGVCETCDLAPKCEGNVQPPAITMPMPELMDVQPLTLDEAGPPGAAADAGDRPLAACEAPRLRIRLASVTVHEEYDDFNNDYVYCVIATEAELQSEIRVTPLYGNGLAAGATHEYSVADGIVWGVDNQLVAPGGNMVLTYNCLESDDTAHLQALLEALGTAADELGGLPIPGVSGWVVPAKGVAGLVSEVLQLNGDDPLFNASQIIDQDLLLTLTQGRHWSVRRSGSQNFSDWDWELRMEAWGCTDDGTL